jgi:hypothetical protein
MMKSSQHYRIKVPNSLAILAVLLLLISTAANLGAGREASSSGQDTIMSAGADNSASDNIQNASKSKSRGLNLGLLLFRRG